MLIMSVFDKLSPFISICQACGMIPFTIERDPATNTFARFSFSFKHFTTWWFLLLCTLHLMVPILLDNLTGNIIYELSTDRSLPITITIVTGVTTVCFLSQLAICRWIVFRHYRKLQNAVKAIQEAEKILNLSYTVLHKNSISKRIVYGIILIIAASIATMFTTIPILQAFLSNMGTLSITCLVFVQFMMILMFDCAFLMIHLCYFIVAYYIQVLKYQLSGKGGNEHPSRIYKGTTRYSREMNMKKLKRSTQIFSYICQALSELNYIFSVPAFLILTMKLVAVVSQAFAFVFALASSNNAILRSAYFMMISMAVTDCVRIFIILSAADMPVNEVRLLRESVYEICYSSDSSQVLSEKVAWMFFLKQMTEDRIRLSAAGLFRVGKHLIPALTGAVVTYMVVLLQN